MSVLINRYVVLIKPVVQKHQIHLHIGVVILKMQHAAKENLHAKKINDVIMGSMIMKITVMKEVA
jgi:hypothetical protein